MKNVLLPVLIFLMLISGVTSFAASFQGLGDLGGGSFNSFASGVSADGLVVIGQSISASGREAFRWTSGGGMVGLGDLAGGRFDSSANSASADGSVIVGYGYSSSGYTPFRWTASSGRISLSNQGSGDYVSEATDVSADGSIVVGDNSFMPGCGFSWTLSAGMVSIGDLPGGSNYSSVNGMSADGSVVVGYSSSALGYQAFRWTSNGGMVGLGDLAGGSFGSNAQAVSADGSVVVGWSISANSLGVGECEAFRWTSSGGMVGLGDLAGGKFESYAFGISANGSVVVGEGDSAIGNEAFYYDSSNGIQNLKDLLANKCGLDLTGWTLKRATGISADGLTVVGSGINPDGNYEAWVATIPEPCSLLLLSFGVVLLRKRSNYCN